MSTTSSTQVISCIPDLINFNGLTCSCSLVNFSYLDSLFVFGFVFGFTFRIWIHFSYLDSNLDSLFVFGFTFRIWIRIWIHFSYLDSLFVFGFTFRIWIHFSNLDSLFEFGFSVKTFFAVSKEVSLKGRITLHVFVFRTNTQKNKGGTDNLA